MILALLLCLQDTVDMKDFKSSYTVVKPADYTDKRSWPAIVDLGHPKDPVQEPRCFVLRPAELRGEDFVLACLMDLKTRFRINPERVIIRGDVFAMSLASNHDDLFAACALRRPPFFGKVSKAPPCVLFLSPRDPDRLKLIVQAGVLKKEGISIEVRDATGEPDEIADAIDTKLRPKANVLYALELEKQSRWLDATLICIDILEREGAEQQAARTLLRSVEGKAIIELAKVEVAVSERKWKDAILRCRAAARQFAWVPSGDRLRRRLAELESRPEVQKALAADD
jgi:hypothetical protein